MSIESSLRCRSHSFAAEPTRCESGTLQPTRTCRWRLGRSWRPPVGPSRSFLLASFAHRERSRPADKKRAPAGWPQCAVPPARRAAAAPSHVACAGEWRGVCNAAAAARNAAYLLLEQHSSRARARSTSAQSAREPAAPSRRRRAARRFQLVELQGASRARAAR